MRRPRVAISGFPFFVETLFGEGEPDIARWKRRILRFDNRIAWFASLCALVRADVWYTIGSVENGRAFELIARLLRKPRVMHWVGSDIVFAREHPRALDRLRKDGVTHVTVADWTAAELRGLGLESSIAPLPPRRMSPSNPSLPEVFTVLLYLPATRAAFYGAKWYERLIESFASEPVRFLVVGGGRLQTQSPRVEYLGWVADLESIYARATVLVRLTERDGLSCMVLEALSFGRWVLWPQEFPFVMNVKTYTDVQKALRTLLNAHRGGRLGLQADAVAHVRERFDRTRCLDSIASIWDAALRTSRRMTAHGAS